MTLQPRVLALETIGTAGSVAALLGGQTVVEIALRPDQRSAQSLAPAIQQALAAAGWQPSQVQVVAVLSGPGSFTGLRVGVTTAKTFAFAVGAAVVAVGSLETLVAQVAAADAARCWTIVDAGRAQQFAASFVRVTGAASAAPGTLSHALWEFAGWQTEREPSIVDNAALLAALRPGDAITGPGLATLGSQLPPLVTAVDSGLWQPRAATVGRLAARRFAHSGRDDLMALVPNYLRRSAAEEKWAGGR